MTQIPKIKRELIRKNRKFIILTLKIATQHYRLNQNHNLLSSRKYVWVIEYWDLGFICNLVLEICNFILSELISHLLGETFSHLSLTAIQ
jgi:hypothetical protein